MPERQGLRQCLRLRSDLRCATAKPAPASAPAKTTAPASATLHNKFLAYKQPKSTSSPNFAVSETTQSKGQRAPDKRATRPSKLPHPATSNMPPRRGRPPKSTTQAKSGRSALSVKSNPPAAQSQSKVRAEPSKQRKSKRAPPTAAEEEEDDDEDELQGEQPAPISKPAVPVAAKQTQRRKSAGTNGGKKKRTATEADLPPPAAAPKRRASGGVKAKTTTSSSSASAAQSSQQETREPATAPTSSRKIFAHLKPRTRHISQSVITTKWRPAPPATQHAARALFLAAKRPVVAALSSSSARTTQNIDTDRRRAEAEATLTSVLRRLEKQLPKIPFPTGGGGAPSKGGGGLMRDGSVFDLDKVVERNRGLEAQLTPALHAVGLLRRAVEREEEVLEAEREALEVLERNRREAERAAKGRARRGVFPGLKRGRAAAAKVVAAGDGAGEIRLVPGEGAERGWERVDTEGGEGEEDEALEMLLGQLRGHVDSIHANAEQVGGLDEAMVEAQVALDEVLRKRMVREQYEGLVAPSSLSS